MVAQHGNAFGIHFVDAPRPCPPVSYQPRVLQHSQVLGYRGTRHWQSRRKLIYCPWVLREQFKDGQARGVAECRKFVLYVSVHLR